MHMSDVLLSPAVAGVMYAGSVAATGYSIYKVKKIDQPESVPVMGVMGAFVFAAQMINFTIPGTGSSGHLCGWRSFGIGGKYLEHGILRMFCRWLSDLESYYETWGVKEKDYCSICSGMHFDITAGSLLRHTGASRFRYY